MKRTVLLIIEDDETRDNIGEILKLYGYNVLTTADTINGLVMAKELKPQVIIASNLLKWNDELALEEYELPRIAGRRIPFLMVATLITAPNNPATHKPIRFFTKPFDINELLKVVAHHCHKDRT